MPKAKPISLKGLKFETIIDTLLKTQPNPKKKQQRQSSR